MRTRLCFLILRSKIKKQRRVQTIFRWYRAEKVFCDSPYPNPNSCHNCATKKQTVNPMAMGRNVATRVQRKLLVSL